MEKIKVLFHAVSVPQYFLTSRRHSRRESWWPSKRALHLLAISIGSLEAPRHKRIIAYRGKPEDDARNGRAHQGAQVRCRRGGHTLARPGLHVSHVHCFKFSQCLPQ